LIGFNLAGVVLFEQVPQALMFKGLDHRPTVKRQLTFVNTEVLRSKLTLSETRSTPCATPLRGKSVLGFGRLSCLSVVAGMMPPSSGGVERD
jgi:hypothetical protein